MGWTCPSGPPHAYACARRLPAPGVDAIGSNLNQLAHQANTRGSALDSELEEAIEKVERLWMLLSPYRCGD